MAELDYRPAAAADVLALLARGADIGPDSGARPPGDEAAYAEALVAKSAEAWAACIGARAVAAAGFIRIADRRVIGWAMIAADGSLPKTVWPALYRAGQRWLEALARAGFTVEGTIRDGFPAGLRLARMLGFAARRDGADWFVERAPEEAK